jgi:hypothetical protein
MTRLGFASTVICVLALVIAVTNGSKPRDPAPYTPENRAKVVEIGRLIEVDPLRKTAGQESNWVGRWFFDVEPQHLTGVYTCPNLLKPLLHTRSNYSDEIYGPMYTSAAAFIVLNPEKGDDELAVYSAGLEGSLRAYQSILKSRPQARWPFLDGLIERRNNGTLMEYVRQVAVKCKDEVDD